MSFEKIAIRVILHYLEKKRTEYRVSGKKKK